MRDYKINKNFLEEIFSIKNTHDSSYKILTILGLEFVFFNYFYFFKNCCATKDYLIRIEKAKEINTLAFEKYKDIYTNKNVAIIAPGMTAKYANLNDNIIKIGTNKAYKFFDSLDYLFIHDITNNGRYMIDETMDLDCVKFFGKFIHKNSDLNAIPIELALQSNAKIYYTRNRQYKEQNSFIFKDITKHPLFDGGTIVHPAINFALFTNPKKIYLIGCDCSDSGYVDGTKQNYKLNFELFYNGYTVIKNFAKYFYPETEIISVNPIGLKGLYNDVYTQNYIDEHPELLNENIKIIEDIV